MVGLVDSATHKISDPLVAKRIIEWLDEVEGQSQNAEHLKSRENFFDRYFTGGYYPKTPRMSVVEWSPITAMLDRGFRPITLNRESKRRAAASGIWNPVKDLPETSIESAQTVEDLFWSIIAKVSGEATERKMFVNIIAMPGWMYEPAIDSLPDWPPEEVAKAGRVLWKRTPEG